MKSLKIWVIAVFAMTFFSCVAYGQGNLGRGGSIFTGGVRGGLTMSQISGDDLSGFHQVGASVAGFVNFPIAPSGKWKFQLEMQFEMKGSRAPTRFNEDGSYNEKYVLNLGYVGIPAIFTYNPFKGIILEFGPVFNVMVYSQEKNNYGVMQQRQPFRRFELAGTLGVAYLFKEQYGVSLRWASSIIPVRVPDWIHDRVQNKQFNDHLTLSFYYLFNS